MRALGCVMLSILACARVAFAGADGVVLESYSGARPDDAAKAVAPLLGELAQRGFATGGEVGGKFEGRISRDAGAAGAQPATFSADVDKGTKAWASGKFEDAVALLSPLVEQAHVVNGPFI